MHAILMGVLDDERGRFCRGFWGLAKDGRAALIPGYGPRRPNACIAKRRYHRA